MTISLIIPCFNEELNINKGVLDIIGNYTARRDEFSEIIIIDDGSSDRSKGLVKAKYLKQFPKFKLIESPHRGKAFAIISGIGKAHGDYVMFSDIDLATPIEEAQKLISEATRGNEIVIGSRSSSREGAPILRKLMAVGFIIVRDLILNLNGIKDTQCGFKLFKRESANNIIARLVVFKNGHQIAGSSVSAGFDLEFLYLARKLKYKIKEVPVMWRHVETKNVNFVKDSLETLQDIFKIRANSLTGKYKV